MMRQAGRYLPEYRLLREKHPFLELCKATDLAVEVTLQPIERFGMDAAVLFSDILLLLEAMGQELHFIENVGPRLSRPIREKADMKSLGMPDPEDDLGFVMDTIRLLRGSMDERTALIGFSGAPFTLATYLIEGGTSRHFQKIKAFMYQESSSFHRLMELLAEAVEAYLKAQVAAGVDAIQLFDTRADVLAPSDYRAFILPYMQRIVQGLKGMEVPVIHFSLGSSTLLDSMVHIGADVLGLDWKIDLEEARERLGEGQAVQGNMEPMALFKPLEMLEATVCTVLDKGARMPGYIFNLGHGVHPKTPLESVYRLVEVVRNYPLSQGGGKGA